jgi:hypothetical protein
MACDAHTQAMAQLQASYEQSPVAGCAGRIVRTGSQDTTATPSGRDWYVRHLEREPSLVAAARWIEGEKLEHEQFHPQVQRRWITPSSPFALPLRGLRF